MQVDTHRERLGALGLDTTNYRALLMLPVVYVVWAEGRVSQHARDLALEVGSQAFGLNGASMRVVRRWLSSPPNATTYRAAFEELRQLVRAVDEPQFDPDMVRLSLSHAESLARANVADPGMRGAPRAVSAAEEKALRTAAAALEVDIGSSWAQLVETLNGDAPPDGEPLQGQDHEVEEAVISTRFNASRRPSAPPSERPRSGTMRHLRTALRTKEIERNSSPPQIKGGKI